MARDAHLTSWYWGASFGGGVALLAAARSTACRARSSGARSWSSAPRSPPTSSAGWAGGRCAGRALREEPVARGALGARLSQGELADRVDASRQTINAIEADKYDPSLPLAFAWRPVRCRWSGSSSIRSWSLLPGKRPDGGADLLQLNPSPARGRELRPPCRTPHRVLSRAGLIGLFSTGTSSNPCGAGRRSRWRTRTGCRRPAGARRPERPWSRRC
jgi:hypothetical protein